MTLIFSCCRRQKPIQECTAQLDPPTALENQANQHSKRGWLSFVDRVVNTLTVPFFVSFRNLFDHTLRRSPDIASAPFWTTKAHLSENPKVMKAILLGHRNNPENGVYSHAKVIDAIMETVNIIYPTIKTEHMILTCGPEETQLYRQLLKDYFMPSEIKKHSGSIQEIIKTTVDKWGQKQASFVINTDIKLMATGIMARIFLNHPGPYDEISQASSHIISWLTDNVISNQSRFYRFLIGIFPKLAQFSPKDRIKTAGVMREAVNLALIGSLNPSEKHSLVSTMRKRNFSFEQIYAMIITYSWRVKITFPHLSLMPYLSSPKTKIYSKKYMTKRGLVSNRNISTIYYAKVYD